jgi:hypothetical protein
MSLEERPSATKQSPRSPGPFAYAVLAVVVILALLGWPYGAVLALLAALARVAG